MHLHLELGPEAQSGNKLIYYKSIPGPAVIEKQVARWFNREGMKKKDRTQVNLTLLHSGKHPQAKKYAGKHVMVIENEVVPRPDISYILN